MSERIDTMAAALIAALGAYGAVHDAGDGWTTLTLHHDDMPRIAHRLLAAMDAEPTEAEVEEAIVQLREASSSYGYNLRAWSDGHEDGELTPIDELIQEEAAAEAHLRSLMAARTARQGGQG